MTEFLVSRNGVPIRLTDERWAHIEESHGELTELRETVGVTVREPERVLAGNGGELLAVRTVEPSKAMVVVYKESGPDDGFVITAFLTRRLASLNRRRQVWPPQM